MDFKFVYATEAANPVPQIYAGDVICDLFSDSRVVTRYHPFKQNFSWHRLVSNNGRLTFSQVWNVYEEILFLIC